MEPRQLMFRPPHLAVERSTKNGQREWLKFPCVEIRMGLELTIVISLGGRGGQLPRTLEARCRARTVSHQSLLV